MTPSRRTSRLHEPLANQLQHFLRVHRGAPCRSDGWFGVGVVEALEAADRSYRDGGGPVDVDDRAPVAGRGVTRVVLCVQNLGVPDDPRVWHEAHRSPPTATT